ncbi:MAG: PilZ domain-containing protein, partial [Hyphomicrobiales bacterium]|nr:PilZ domain-containing protein [Hyphomicrobiales bacterium]
VVRLFEGGFAIRLNSTSYKREKIANQLTWIVNKSQLELAEDRAFGRSVPSRRHVKITFTDGSEYECQVQDVSLNGVSVSVRPKPEVGEPVMVSLIRGTVVRHHDRGIGIRFNEIQDPSTIERHFG